MEFSEIWRILNAVLALIALAMLVRESNAVSSLLAPRGRVLTLATELALFGIAWASVEALLQGNPLGGRTAIFTCVSGLVIYALTFTKREFTSS